MTALESSLQIVLIDGDELDSELTSFEFTSSGHTVTVPTENEVTETEWLSFTPDIVFIDVSLPDALGFDIARKLQAEPFAHGAWLVAMRVDDAPNMNAVIKECGFHFQLSKGAEFGHQARLVEARARLKVEQAKLRTNGFPLPPGLN